MPIPPRSFFRFGIPAFLALLTGLAFLPSLHGQFLNYDDDFHFLNNPHFRGLTLENLKWMFFRIDFGLYMPLAWVTLALNYEFGGMNPTGYHAFSIALHAANAALLYAVAARLFKRARPEASDRTLAAVAAATALFYALHPLRVESVAWLTERRDVLSGFFFLLTVLTYLRSTDDEPRTASGRRWFALSCVCFAATMLSKPMALALPIVLLVLDFYPLGRFSKRGLGPLLIEKAPLFVLMVLSAVFTFLAERSPEALYTREAYPITQSLAQPGYRVSFYLLKTLWPFELSPLYWFRPEIGWRQALGWTVLIGVSAALILRRRQAPGALAAWICYGLLIGPVCGIFQVGPNFAADRYTYFASIPLALLIGGLLLLRPGGARVPKLAAAIVVLAGLTALTARQCLVWKDSLTLWNYVLSLEPDVYLSYAHRGDAKAELGDLGGAIEDYSRSISLQDGWSIPWSRRGLARANQGDLQNARVDFTEALRRDPRSVDALIGRGRIRSQSEDPSGAIADLNRAIEIRPTSADALAARGFVLLRTGQVDRGLSDFDAALRIRPEPVLYLRRAMGRGLKGDLEGVIADCSEALRLKPDYAEAYLNRGMARAERKDAVGAAQDFAKALEVAPPNWPQRNSVEALLQGTRK